MAKIKEQVQVSFTHRVMSENDPLHDRWDVIATAGQQALDQVLQGLSDYTDGRLSLSDQDRQLVDLDLRDLVSKYIGAWTLLDRLATRSVQGARFSDERMVMNNPVMTQIAQDINLVVPKDTRATVLDGITPEKHRAGLKEFPVGDFSKFVIDLLGSATSLNLGAHFPWVSVIDHIEDKLGIKDNFCLAYHAATKLGFVLPELAKLHPKAADPGWAGWQQIRVYTETSGSVVNSHAIQTACAFVEAKTGNPKAKILAVDGTWCAGVGAGKEGTGFGVATQQEKRQGGTVWVDRALPAPTRENMEQFLDTVEEYMERGELAGVILEPVIGDAGIIPTDPELVTALTQLLSTAKDKHGQAFSLPLIIDCVQQGTGRTSPGYWGTSHLPDLENYESLILTTAKSASNGQPFGFSLIPAAISEAAYDYAQVTTNALNGSLLRALVVAKFVTHPEIQALIQQNSQIMDRVASRYPLEEWGYEFRGLGMNRGLDVVTNEMVEVLQYALFIQDGILVGALPHTLRIQPMLIMSSETLEKIMVTIFERINSIRNGDIPEEVAGAIAWRDDSTGLAVDNM